MDAIKQWAVTCCFAALAAGIANIAIPKGNMEKVCRFAVSLFFMCCVLTPLFSLKGVSLGAAVSSAASMDNSALQKEIQNEKLTAAKENIADQIRSAFVKYGVTPVSVTVNAQTDKSGAIAVIGAQVTVSRSDAAKIGSAAAGAKQELGIDISTRSQ